MIQALIIEDEENSKDILTSLLRKHCNQVAIAGYAADANEAVEKIELLKPDMVFMDIELPYGNAFDILARLKEFNFHIVFTTAYDDYILKAIRAGAIDYLLKPIDYKELTEAVNKIEKKINERQSYLNLELLIASFSKQINNDTLALPTMEGYSFIRFEDIIRISAEGNYCKIYCLNKQTFTISRQIHEIESKLPSSVFCRVHNSYIINIKHIKEYIKGRGGSVRMTDGSEVDVSNKRKDQFLERFS
jgi:two-component system LytT family response regulator